MKRGYTDITIVLDRSGSMQTIRNDMVNGLKSFIEEQRKVPGECKITLIQFDSNQYETVFVGADINSDINIDLIPRGCTPLLDALGRAINDTGMRFEAMAEAERPENVIMLIITDGEENASREFSAEVVRQMTSHQIAQYNWHFSYLGANQDGFTVATSVGIPLANTLNYQASPQGVQAMYHSVSSATSNLRTGKAKTVCYNDADRQAQGGPWPNSKV